MLKIRDFSALVEPVCADLRTTRPENDEVVREIPRNKADVFACVSVSPRPTLEWVCSAHGYPPFRMPCMSRKTAATRTARSCAVRNV